MHYSSSSKSSTVFVGGLTYRVRERHLERFFSKYGRIKEIAIKNGFAFVEFDDYRDAEDAIYELNGRELCGDRVSVERARGTPRGSDRWRTSSGSGGGRSYDPPPRRRSRDDKYDKYDKYERYGPPTRTEYRVIVENLSSRVSWQDLKDYIRQAGVEVSYADAHKRKNEGLVEFSSYSDLRKAIDKLDGAELNGRKIHMIEVKSNSRARSRSSDSRSRSRSRRRSHSRSRSGSRRSRSKSRDRSKSKSRSHSHKSRSESKRTKSRSISKGKEEKARSVSRSRSVSRDRSKSRSRSRSASNGSRSRSRSAANADNDRNGD